MGRYLLTDSAQSDLREIISYIRQRNPNAARRVKREFRDAMRKLADFPQMGHLRADVADEELRFWSLYSYFIVYRAQQRPIQVVRVVHGARDIGQLFRGA